MSTGSFQQSQHHGNGVSTKPVFLITHEFFPVHGGIATFSEEIARAGVALGHNIEVWAQKNGAHEKSWPFPVRRMPVRGTHDFVCRARLALELIRNRRHLRGATVFMPEPAPLLAMMPLQFFAAFRPKRLIVTFHGSEILRFYRNPVYRVLTRRLIRNAARVSTLSAFTRDLLYECFPEATGKTIITPGALRSNLAPENREGGAGAGMGVVTLPALGDAPVALEQAAPGKLVVLTVGRLHPRKGQIHAMRALQALPERLRANVEYWIVGKSGNGAGADYERELRAAAARDGVLAVRFLGEVADNILGKVYERADVFAMTSINYRQSVEGFGLVYLEASVHGLPIVAHGVGGVSEAVIDGKTGFVVPPPPPDSNDVGGLASVFQSLLCDPAMRERLGAAGREHARLNTWKDSAQKLFAPLTGATAAPFAAT
jgi:glycosyltransferase involved in cell wall biosynthesis